MPPLWLSCESTCFDQWACSIADMAMTRVIWLKAESRMATGICFCDTVCGSYGFGRNRTYKTKHVMFICALKTHSVRNVYSVCTKNFFCNGIKNIAILHLTHVWVGLLKTKCFVLFSFFFFSAYCNGRYLSTHRGRCVIYFLFQIVWGKKCFCWTYMDCFQNVSIQ